MDGFNKVSLLNLNEFEGFSPTTDVITMNDFFEIWQKYGECKIAEWGERDKIKDSNIFIEV